MKFAYRGLCSTDVIPIEPVSSAKDDLPAPVLFAKAKESKPNPGVEGADRLEDGLGCVSLTVVNVGSFR